MTFINSVNIIIYYKDMILIADSGSTKVDWCFVEGASIVKQVSTSGINPVVMSEDEVSACIGGQLMPQMEGLSPASVHFYGAGCVSDEKCAIVASAISGHIPDVSVTVDSDMLAAARAICGSDPGIACILGTGSNSCVYDGRHIIDNVSPLGYILGDEGSGAVLGKMLVGDVLKRQLPEELCARFLEQYIGSRRPTAFWHHLLHSFWRISPTLPSTVLSCVRSSLSLNGMWQTTAPTGIWLWALSGLLHITTAMSLLMPPGNSVAHWDAYCAALWRGWLNTILKKSYDMTFVKVTEQPSLYDGLDKKPVIYLLREINEEDKKVAFAVEKAIPQIERLVTSIVSRMKRGGRIFYMGAGTSGRLGVLDASEIPPTFGMDPTWVIGIIAGGDGALRNPVENAEDDLCQGWRDLERFNINSLDTVIGIAASGTTPYVISAIEECRRRGILTASITSNPDAPISAVSDIPIEMVVGPEYVTGSSRMKSGTGQKMICNMISTAVMIKMGRVKGNRMVNMQLTNAKLVDRGARMVAEELSLPYEEAKRLLLMHGSVKKAVDDYREHMQS